LASHDQEITIFQPRSTHRGNYVRQSRSCGDESKCPTVGGNLVEIFGGDSCGNFMNNGHTLKACSGAVEEVHDIATRDEETMRVAEIAQPIN
jgi:hypothetical protein